MLIFTIKEIRTKKDISLYKLSQMTNLSRTYLRNLENNKCNNPSVNVLEKISIALNVNIKDLFYSTKDISELKNKLNKKIKIHGINSDEVLEISRIIDFLINIDFKNSDQQKN